MDQKHIISLKNIEKSYDFNSNKIPVLKNLNANFSEGKFYIIVGASGCGKSTLINILGLIDEFNAGSYELFGNKVNKLKDKQLSFYRMNNIGFVFQDFQLIETSTALENVMMPMLINSKISKNERKGLAQSLLTKVNLETRVNHFPKEMSGGEKQRVAIARALANNPSIILADEPTGNLDKKSEKEIFDILKELSKDGKCVIVVSHSEESKKYADVIYELSDGKLDRITS